MNTSKFNLTIILLIAFLNSCGILYKIKYNCRDFIYDEEEYWFPDYSGNIITYVNSENQEWEFMIEEKILNHTISYRTDTGCACRDESIIKLINGDNSITLMKRNSYIYNRNNNIFERINILINNKSSVFDDKNIEYTDSININNNTLKNLKIYSKKGAGDVTKLIFAKGIGLVQFEHSNGIKWVLKYINEPKNNFRHTFKYIESDCKFNGTSNIGIEITP